MSKFCNCGFGEIVKFNNFLYYENNILQIRKVYFLTFFCICFQFLDSKSAGYRKKEQVGIGQENYNWWISTVQLRNLKNADKRQLLLTSDKQYRRLGYLYYTCKEVKQ